MFQVLESDFIVQRLFGSQVIKYDQPYDQKEMNASMARAVSVVCIRAVSSFYREHDPETNRC